MAAGFLDLWPLLHLSEAPPLFYKCGSSVFSEGAVHWHTHKHQARSGYMQDGSLILAACGFEGPRTVSYFISPSNPCSVPGTPFKVQRGEDGSNTVLSSYTRAWEDKSRDSVVDRQDTGFGGHRGIRSKPLYWQLEFGFLCHSISSRRKWGSW